MSKMASRKRSILRGIAKKNMEKAGFHRPNVLRRKDFEWRDYAPHISTKKKKSKKGA